MISLLKFMEDCPLWEGCHAGAGEGRDESFPKEEGAAESLCDELTTLSIPHPLMLLPWGAGK